MFPLLLPGLAVAGIALFSKLNTHPLPNKKHFQLKEHPRKKFRLHNNSTSTHNPLNLVFKNLRSTLVQGSKKPAGIDYDSIINSFLPADAEISTPEFPVSSQRYQILDLDADSHKEIIVSYKQREEITTMILKEKSGSWHKVAKISHPGYTILHYRDVATLSDEGRKQLLIGLTGNGLDPSLFGYSMENNDMRTLFNRSYHRLELVSQQTVRNDSLKQHLALWERSSANTYNIDVLHLKNNQVEAVSNIDSYYSANVVPYYLRKVKQSPSSTENWYNLSEALVRLKAYNDAQITIDLGIKTDGDSIFREKFDTLKRKLK